MDNPLLASVLKNFPDVQASSLSWPAGAESWDEKDLELFIGSGGFLKPKKEKSRAQETRNGVTTGKRFWHFKKWDEPTPFHA